LKNIPEPEAPIFKATLIYKDLVYDVSCNIYDFLDCEANDCALDLFESYIQKYVEKEHRGIITIENIRGGKIFVYSVNGSTVCLCIHRAEIDCAKICKSYEK